MAETSRGTAATLRPDRFGDQYEGHDITLGDMDAIWSVGATPREAIEAFCLARCGTPLESLGEALPSTAQFPWGFRFTCDGTGFKAAGINVPGGVVLTWWK